MTHVRRFGLAGLVLGALALALVLLMLPQGAVAADTCTDLNPVATPRVLPDGFLTGYNFSWTAHPDAVLYRVRIWSDTGVVIERVVNWTALYYGVGDLGVGTFAWSVTALDANGNAVCAQDGTFDDGATHATFDNLQMCPPEGCWFPAPVVIKHPVFN